MINLPSKYILLGTNPLQDSFIIEMKLIPVTNELNIAILIYKLQAKLTQALVSSFESNDTNTEYFNKIPKQLIYNTSFSEKIGQYVLYVLYQELNNLENRNKPQININFQQLTFISPIVLMSLILI